MDSFPIRDLTLELLLILRSMKYKLYNSIFQDETKAKSMPIDFNSANALSTDPLMIGMRLNRARMGIERSGH